MKINKKIILCIFVSIFILSFVSTKDFDGVFGMYRLELHEKSGTFTLSMLDSKGDKFTPVLNPLDNSSGTLFYLKAGSKVYPLSKLGGVPIVHEMNENRAVITYNIKNVAEVSLSFSFVSSETGTFTEYSDLVIVDVLVKNISKKTNVYGLRSVFDTFLGENSPIHFSTKTLNLNTEALFNSMHVDKWIKSSDGRNSIKFLLDGETITRPSSVVVANRDILTVNSWEPKLVPGRGFNSLFSLNNSALGITWNSYKLAPEKLFGVRFYISAATDYLEPMDTSSNFFASGKALQSASFVYDSDKLVAEEIVEYVVLSTSDKKDDKNDNSKISVEETESTDESIGKDPNVTEDVSPVEVFDDSSEELTSDNISEDFVLSESSENVNLVEPESSMEETDNLPYVDITPEKLNLEYVEELIKEIDELEHNPELYDASRILYLHTELDAILKILEL